MHTQKVRFFVSFKFYIFNCSFRTYHSYVLGMINCQYARTKWASVKILRYLLFWCDFYSCLLVQIALFCRIWSLRTKYIVIGFPRTVYSSFAYCVRPKYLLPAQGSTYTNISHNNLRTSAIFWDNTVYLDSSTIQKSDSYKILQYINTRHSEQELVTSKLS